MSWKGLASVVVRPRHMAADNQVAEAWVPGRKVPEVAVPAASAGYVPGRQPGLPDAHPNPSVRGISPYWHESPSGISSAPSAGHPNSLCEFYRIHKSANPSRNIGNILRVFRLARCCATQ